ncbi:hypothetical protein KY092_18680 [Natronomonas gomsonensis]|uniref:DUF7093 family protein n=1 Tax=Natronomonas gomsonensis TaxID=1046043 RepID=UPI00227AF82D|nr:hypothetical protein [Natronomonas gomsonensis]MCY4732570.1 hypothetical protein [Natronomonas gomsonensis]
MGVRCVISGHLYETTEFEEHRRERPEGTVLVCREYQVCSRCGNREEMYRNEQLLTPREDMNEERGSENGTSDTEKPEGDSVSDQSSFESGENSPEVIEDHSEHTSSTDTASSLKGISQLEGGLNGDASDSSVTTNDISTPRADEKDDTDTPEVIKGSIDFESLPGGTRATEPDEDDAGDEAERVSRVQPPKSELTEMSDHRSNSGSQTNASSRTDNTYSPLKGDTAKDATADTTNDEATDDAVIISGEDASTSSSNEHGSRHDTGLRCQACGGTWDGETTSLRDGDLCPECRRGYVEIR